MTTPVLTTVRQMQVPLLSALLLGACAAKLIRVLRAGSVSAVLDASVLFPPRLRRAAAICVCLAELGLGLGLAVTAEDDGGQPVALRLATALFFLVAMSALLELRDRHPHLGCGCFGDLSIRPIGARSIIRAAYLAGAALASIGVPPLRVPPPGPATLVDLCVLAAGLVVIAALSPEASEVLVRLGYSAPCELRASPPPQRILASLRRSRAWRRHSRLIHVGDPTDMWRELCWWYVVYPAGEHGAAGDIVFAVAVKTRHPAVRVAVAPRHLVAPDQQPAEDRTLKSAALYGPLAHALDTPIQAESPRRCYTGCSRRNLPKCGTVKEMSPRSEL